MLSAEVQRIGLLIGLAATGYLMILAWNDDFVQSHPAQPYASTPDLQPLVSDAVVDPAAPSIPQNSMESDVPDASLIAPSEPAQSSTAPAVSPGALSSTERLIRVKTPQLNVWIDRLGGDIVRVELPKFPVSLEQPDVPFQLLDNGRGHTYIAQSGLAGADGVDAQGQRPLYRANASEFRLTGTEPLQVDLKATVGNQDVLKRYEFQPDGYLVDLSYQIDNRESRPIQASLFAQIKRDAKDPPSATTGFSMGPKPYVGGALTTVDDRYAKVEFDDLDEGPYRASVEGGWIAFLQHYFLSAWVADPEVSNNYYGQKRNDGTYVFGYTGPLKTIAAGGQGHWRTQFYAGPKDQKKLGLIAPNLNMTVDYGFLWWLAEPLFSLLDWLHGMVNNWGVAIILLTLLVKLVLFPLSAASYKSMANMRRVQPKMKRLQERYADDRQKLSQEMMSFYKKEKVNPLGGCLPMLLPMPIFIALYWVLFESVELRQAPFFLWINDLAAMDPFFILPLLMGGSMFLTQMMSPAVGDPMQVKMMKMMPIMFTVLFLFFPAGLVLYWLVNNVLGVAQQYYVIRKTEREQAAAG